MHIQNYLGTDLYNKISADIIAGTLTGDYLELVNDYIQPMLIHFAMVDYLPFASYELRNGGLFRHRSENAENPTKEEVDFLTQKHHVFLLMCLKLNRDCAPCPPVLGLWPI